jgi:hypothetical protein
MIIKNLSTEHKDKINNKKHFLWKANEDSEHSGFILRKEVGMGFLKLNNKGSVVLVLPESYTINPENYSQVTEEIV